MLNTMTVTKTVAALCGALLVFLLAGWAGRALYATGPHEGETVASSATEAPAPAAAEAPSATEAATEAEAPAETETATAAETATETEAATETATETATEAEAPAQTASGGEGTAAEATGAAAGAAGDDEFTAAFAAADPAAGEKVFGKCKACHQLNDKNAAGPHLDGVVGRPIASVEGFKYSNAMIAHQGATWEPATLSEFLTSPKTFAPGTKMSFAGLPKIADRANLIAFLAAQKD